MWGTLNPGHHRNNGIRFIPTDVGNASLRRFLFQPRTVHPHGCGERKRVGLLRDFIFGSSPRMWGTPSISNSDEPGNRFIPTDVGNAVPPRKTFTSSPVHPHGCGERLNPLSKRLIIFGSSPRMWGTPPFIVKYSSPLRFIPTDVGNAGQQP